MKTSNGLSLLPGVAQKKISVFLVSLLSCVMLISCQTSRQEVVSAAEPVTLPMEMSYKAEFVIGDMNNVKTVVEWNKRLSVKNTDLSDLLYDTVTFSLADGTTLIKISRDSAVLILKEFMSGITNLKIEYITSFPIDNTLQKHQWVMSLTDETITYKDGKVEHGVFFETYFMEKGKIKAVYQYKRDVLTSEEKPV
jgi:hypothetical protein